MEILFFDAKKKEQLFFEKFLKPIDKNVKLYYSPTSIDLLKKQDNILKNITAISTFVNSKLDEKILSNFENLKYIFLRSVGFSNVDLKYCKRKNIEIYNSPNYGNSTVAEYVFALIFALIRKNNKIGIELCNKTLGIIGTGRIGKKVINIAKGFDMKILAYDINPNSEIELSNLDEIFKKSDFLSINCPLNDTTKNLINKNTILKMKHSAFIINTARGEIINTKDLYYALLSKRIKGAALDVLECEELYFQNKHDFQNLNSNCLESFFYAKKLSELENVIITSHNAYNTHEAINRILHITFCNIKQIIENSGKKNLVLL